MFSRRGIKILFIIFFLFLAGSAFSFNDVITHPLLARKAVELFNESSENKISSPQEINWIMQGAQEEDTPIRWMNHFYNPKTGAGLFLYSPAKDWAEQNMRQSLYPKGNQTWQKAINSYVKGDKKEAFIALGHNLHLIEDMAVPAHTRDDIHPFGDPLETWAKNNADGKFVKTSITEFNSLEEYFNSLANYSNKYFLSEDSIDINDLKSKNITTKKIGDGKILKCVEGQDSLNERFCLILVEESYFNKFYFIDDPAVHSDYYSLLAPKAISYGAGMIELFFKEVEKKKEEQAEKSWLDKLKHAISNIYPKSLETNLYNPASFDEAGKEIARKAGEIAGAVIKEGGRVLSAKITAEDLLKPKQIEASDNPLPPESEKGKEGNIKIPLTTPKEKSEEKSPQAKIIPNSPVFIFPSGGNSSGANTSSAPASNSGDQASTSTPASEINNNLGEELETIILKSPLVISSSTVASFIFQASDNEAGFEYNLNNNGWISCGNSLNLPGLADGGHVIEVRALDSPGNINNSPAIFSWVIDTASSAVTIANSPASFASSTRADFLFESNEEDVIYFCQLDNGSWESCQASTTVSDLIEGEHIFSVKGVDIAGNISSSTVYNWLVDITAPTSTMTNLAGSYSATGFTVEWQGNDIASSTGSGIKSYDVQYKIESGDWQEWIIATSSTESVFDIAVEAGKNIYFRVRANDKAGNIGQWSDEAATKIALPPVNHLVISEFVTRGPAGAYDEFVELYNPTSETVNLKNWKLQTKSAIGDSWINRTGASGLPAGEIIASRGYYLLTAKDYSLSQLPDYRHSANWGLTDSGGHLRIINNLGEEIDKVGYGNALDPEGNAFVVDLSDGSSLERKADQDATSASMIAGSDKWQGNGYDSEDNSKDFIVRVAPQPQNSLSPTEPRDSEPILPNAISDLEILHIYTTATSVKLHWTSPANANLNNKAYYDLRYKEKAGECDLQISWHNAYKIATSSLPVPASSTGQDQIAEITDLSSGVEYCFALMTYNGQNWSALSNQVAKRTLSSPTQLTKLTYDWQWRIVSQTLTPDKSPYYIDFSSILASDQVLTIEPGVVIKLAPWYPQGVILYLNGQIKARGTANNPIVFTSIYDDAYAGDSNGDGNATLPAAGNWGGFQIGSEGNVFEHVIIKYGGADQRGLMTFYNNSGNKISASAISHNLYGLVFPTSSSSQPTIIEDSDLSYTELGSAITVGSSANPIIKYNNIHHNQSGISVFDQAIPVIINNNIYSNSVYGVAAYNLADADDVNAQFNWWGDATGPSHANNGDGTGDKVTNKVDYSHWLLNKY